MTPLRLRLKGFAGIKAGLGLDELVVDLRTLPEDAGLVALTGPNGAGKSTILDNLHPYRVMPSRSLGDSLTGFSFYEHLFQSEAVKELLWELGGRTYRSELVFRSNGKRKTEAFLHVEEGGRWVPVKLPDGTISDGRTDSYDACVSYLLGGVDTFFTSHFAAQGRRPLSEYKPAEIKTLLTELLGLDAIRQVGDKASEVGRLLKAGLITLRAELQALQRDRTGVAERLQGLGATEKTLAKAVSERATGQVVVEEARASLLAIQNEEAAQAQVTLRRQALVRARSQAEESHIQTSRALEQQVDQCQKRIGAIQASVERRAGKAESRRAELLEHKRLLQQTLATQGSVERAVKRLPTREQVLAAREGQVTELEGRLASARVSVVELHRNEELIAALEVRAGQSVLRVEELKKRLRLADEVPCAGSVLQGRCQLLAVTHEAKAVMPSAETELAQLATQREQLRRLVRDLSKAPTELASEETRLRDAQQRLKRSFHRARQTAVRAATQPEVSQAKQLLNAIEVETVELDSTIACRPTHEEALQVLEAENLINRIKSQVEEIVQSHQIDSARLRQELDALPAELDPHKLTAAKERLHKAEECRSLADAAYESAVRVRQQAIDLQAQLESSARKLETVEERLRLVEGELAVWTLIARSLSNDGVVALSIDDAGPALSSLTNALLLSCYGPRFTVSIKTQVPTAKGDLREGFDIIVSDGDSGQSKSVSVMSGGERVWINECLTRAIALYLAQSCNCTMSTLFSDEVDGPLDAEHKRMFISMKREVLRLGGYRREYFVSQTPELTTMADAVIDVEQLCTADANREEVVGTE